MNGRVIILGVSVSVLAVLIVGILVARKVDGDSANFLVAGRQLGVPLVAVSLTAAAVDSNAMVGNTDLTSQAGSGPAPRWPSAWPSACCSPGCSWPSR